MRHLVALGWCVLVLGFSVLAHAVPCGTLSLANGLAEPEQVLRAQSPLASEDAACVSRIGSLLAVRPGVRTVTVTAKVEDAARVDGTGTRVVEETVAALVAAGLAATRVSRVVGAGDGTLFISFSERRTTHDVGSIMGVTGEVVVEDATGTRALVPTTGDTLRVGDWVSTGAEASAMLALADGSRVRVKPGSRVRIGALHLNEQLQRVVEIEVTVGMVEIDAEPGEEGAEFRVISPFGSAGVRGTTFRVTHEDTKDTRLETLIGSVALQGRQGEVLVEAAFGSRMGADGAPEEPTALLRPPIVRGPWEGALPASGLQWRRVRGAESYRVELADDAEFTIGVKVATVLESQTKHQPPASSGTRYWRVAAVDSTGFIGMWSKVYAFEPGH